MVSTFINGPRSIGLSSVGTSTIHSSSDKKTDHLSNLGNKAYTIDGGHIDVSNFPPKNVILYLVIYYMKTLGANKVQDCCTVGEATPTSAAAHKLKKLIEESESSVGPPLNVETNVLFT